MAGEAFDLAERLQTPVFVLSDLDLGMNLWISEEFEYPEKPLDRGKVLSAEQLAQFKEQHNGQRWGRYLDVDGDGIPYRTLPGTPNPAAAYFTRGSGHTEYATYTERPEIWERNLKRVEKKFETARSLVPAPIVEDTPGATIGILSFGTNHPAVVEAQARLEKAEYRLQLPAPAGAAVHRRSARLHRAPRPDLCGGEQHGRPACHHPAGRTAGSGQQAREHGQVRRHAAVGPLDHRADRGGGVEMRFVLRVACSCLTQHDNT